MPTHENSFSSDRNFSEPYCETSDLFRPSKLSVDLFWPTMPAPAPVNSAALIPYGGKKPKVLNLTIQLFEVRPQHFISYQILFPNLFVYPWEVYRLWFVDSMLAQGFGKVLQIFIPILLYFLTVDRFFNTRAVVNFYLQIKHFSKYKFFRTQTYKLKKKNIYILILFNIIINLFSHFFLFRLW